MARIESLALVLLVVALPIGWALPAPLPFDDAGSGQDAGGTTATAMPLAYGAYHGNLTLSDADWFVFPAGPTLGCMDANFFASNAMRIGFGAGGASAIGALDDGEFHATLAVGAVAPRLAALPDEAPWDAVSVGPYSFEVAVAAPTLVGDTNVRDAPSTTGAALPVPGECFRGHFRADGSDVDIYRFAAAPGDVATFTLAQAGGVGATAFVLDSAGQQIGSSIAVGEIGQLALPPGGPYYLGAISAPSSASTSYALALVAGPEPTSCRPYCLGVS